MNVLLLFENFFIILLMPFIFTIFISIIVRLFRVHQWRRVHLVAQWTALAYVAGVIILIEEMYNQFILSYVLISFLLFLAIHVTVQWYKQSPISLMKAIVLLLRIVFLLFLTAYITLLTIYGIRIFA